jgi:hypothetical protein
MIELVTTKMSEGSIRVALYDPNTDRLYASTYSIKALKDEDTQFSLAEIMVGNVRPQAGRHVVHEVAEMIKNAIKEYE